MLTYGITPPKAKNTEERIWEIAEKQISRIKNLGADALILYDIQDESDRITDNRPYPFLPTLDPKVYAEVYLKELTIPKILFRSVGNYTPEQLEAELKGASPNQKYVFVGASSQNQKVQITLDEAYQLCHNSNKDILLGGIMIPERHQKKNDEHFRVKNKISMGCEFFISQAVYHSEASKNFLSDYYYLFETLSEKMRPIVFTLTLCGSPKTLEFLKWLGVSVPKWVENELLNSKNILQKSFEITYQIYKELHEFASDKNIPVGFNIESVSINKEEIEASIELFKKVKKSYKHNQSKHTQLADSALF
jgi:hypothetical protein